jgi:hypothetical protein
VQQLLAATPCPKRRPAERKRQQMPGLCYGAACESWLDPTTPLPSVFGTGLVQRCGEPIGMTLP